MKVKHSMAKILASATAAICAQAAVAGTDVFFNPLTQSAAVAPPNHVNELTQPWVTPAGISQRNLMSMDEVEADVTQSVVRVDTGDNSQSMFDMIAYDPSGKYLFIPHETPIGAGVTRYDLETDTSVILFSGDLNGAQGDWSNDYGAFDPARFTPNGTVWLGEEWSGEGRIIEVMNPFADPADIEIRELHSIANVSHEGIQFSNTHKDAVYYVDENNTGSIYKFVMSKNGDYTKGQTFVLSVDAFAGDPAANYSNSDVRTGLATWVAMTDKDGVPLTTTDPFAPGTQSGRSAADEVGGTPYGRPEDMEISRLRNGKEVIYFTATSEQAVYSVEILSKDKAYVRLFASEFETPKNMGFPATTGVMNSPDNLAIDALGNIYIIEDAPNGSSTGGDIWFARDLDNDGEAESIYHFMSIQASGSEATGMIFSPTEPTKYVVAVQHPDSVNLANVPNGFGDAVWEFDLTEVVPPACEKGGRYSKQYVQACSYNKEVNFIEALEKTCKKKGSHKHKSKHRH